MNEESLADIELSGDELRVSALKREGKANLEASQVMTRLRSRREEYRERRRQR